MMVNKGTTQSPEFVSRIATLQPGEIGYQKIISLEQNGDPVNYEIYGTIMKVFLNKPLSPGQKATFEMDFEGQVPLVIRRAGRNNADGVALSMAQWYMIMKAGRSMTISQGNFMVFGVILM